MAGMKPHYDWYKGQDAWEQSESLRQLQENAVVRPKLPGRLRFGIAVVLIFSLIGASVFWFLNRRARTNSAAVEGDILRTNSLVFQALREGDYELFQSNLSGRDPRWVSGLSNSISNGLVFDRTTWGLDFIPPELDDSTIDIKLNPEWNTAELTLPLSFAHNDKDAINQVVTLEQTLIYRRSRDRWLLSPADGNFWGERLVYEGQYLTLDYPARDEEIIERLATDLNNLIKDICTSPMTTPCPADFHISTRFYQDSPNIAGITPPVSYLPCEEEKIELPTPTLVGLPVDETGFEVLLAGYRSEIATFTIANLNFRPTCSFSRLKMALIDYQLSKMAVRPMPITEQDFLLLANEGVHLEQMFYILQEDGKTPLSIETWAEDLRPSYALIIFLIEEYGASLAEIGAYIDQDRLGRGDYWSTLHNWTDDNFADNGPLEIAWERFLVEKSARENVNTPEFPNENLRMVCYGGDITTGIAYPDGVLYEMDMETEEMTAVFSLNHTDANLVALPDDSGAIVAEKKLEYVNDSARLLVWEDEEPRVLLETNDNILLVGFPGLMGREDELVVYNLEDNAYGLFSPTQCQTAEFCSLSPLQRPPVWSPSGERNVRLILRDNLGYEDRSMLPFRLDWQHGDVLGPGKSQFWLDEDQFGFIAEDNRTVMAVTVGKVGIVESMEVLFTLTEVDPLMAQDEKASIEAVVSNPKEPMDLIVTVTDRTGLASIYQVNILRRWIQRLVDREFRLEQGIAYKFHFSPVGRWLLVSANDLNDSTVYLHMFDTELNETHSFEYRMVFDHPMHWVIDWSAGDEWLAVPDNGYIRLINPERDYQDVIVPDGVSCSGAVWVD